MKLNECTDISICDECKHVFPVKTAKMIKFGDSFSAPFASFLFIDKDGKMNRGQPRSDEHILGCPKCGKSHLFGFDKKT